MNAGSEKGDAGLSISSQLFTTYVDVQIQQLETVAAIAKEDGSIDLVTIGHDVHAIAFFVSDQGIEGDVISCLFGAQDNATGEGGACFEGEPVGRADGGEIRLQGYIARFLITAAAFAGEGEADDCNHHGADERFPRQFPPFYRSQFRHPGTNVVNKIG